MNIYKLQVTNTTMMHQSQQEAIIITLMWRVGTTAFHSEKHKPPKRVHTHLEHNLISWVSIYQNVVNITDEVKGEILM